MIRIVVFCALGLLVGVLVFVWLVGRIRYRIGSKQLKVILFGLPVRRVPLLGIDSVAKRPGEGFCEYWWSTFHPKHRMLVIRRKRGLFRNFVITPKNRYVFKSELEKAIDRARRHSGGPTVNVQVEDLKEEDLQTATGPTDSAADAEQPEHHN